MTQQELDALQGLCEEATAGPWQSGDGSVDRFFAGKNTIATPARVIVERATYNDEFDQQTYADIAFIAAARTAMPALIAEVRRLQAEIDRNAVFLAAHGIYSFEPAKANP